MGGTAHAEHRDIGVLWFKRDLRLKDHEPLYRLVTAGRPAVLLYVYVLI